MSVIVAQIVYKITKMATEKTYKLNVVNIVVVTQTLKQKLCTIWSNKMAKMRLFKFWNADGVEKEKEEISLKKATRAVQGDFKDKEISVEYISKKGKEMCHSIMIPIGRKLRQSILQEKRRLALKAKLAR